MPKQIVNISDTIKQFQEKFNTLSTDLGWRGRLATDEDSDFVGSINELEAAARGSNSDYAMKTTAQNFRDAINEHDSDIGNREQLNTDWFVNHATYSSALPAGIDSNGQASLTAAINEVDFRLDSINDTSINSPRLEITDAAAQNFIKGNLDINGNVQVDGTLTVDGVVNFKAGTDGAVTLGDANTDNVVFNADVNSNIIPNTDSAYDLGSASQQWRNLYVDGVGFIDNVQADAAQIGTVNVTDLTDNRVVIVGTGGELEDDANLTYDGTDLSTNSLKVTDLTDNRVVIVGTGGAIEDDANFTFNGTQLNIGTGNFTVQHSTGNVYTAGELTVGDSAEFRDNVVVDGNTNLAGELRVGDSAEFNSNVVVDGNLNVATEASLASATVRDLTDNRVVIAGTNGAIEDDSNLTFDGTTFKVGGTNFTVTQASGNTAIAGTLGVTGNTTLSDELIVGDSAEFRSNIVVDGNANINNINARGTLSVTGNTTLGDELVVVDSAEFRSNIVVDGDANINNITARGDVDVLSNLHVSDSSSFDSNLSVDGNIVIGGTVRSNNTAFKIQADSAITDNVNLSDTIRVSAGEGLNSILIGDKHIRVGGELASTSNIGVAKFNTNDFSVTSGNVSIKTSGVSNAQIANSYIKITGDSSGTDTVNLGETLAVVGGDGVSVNRSDNQLKINIDADGVTNTMIDNSFWNVADSAGNTYQIDLGDTLNLKGEGGSIRVTKSATDDTIEFRFDSDIRVDGDLVVHRDATVSRDLTVTRNLIVSGATRITAHKFKMGEGTTGDPTLNGIISVDRGTEDSAELVWNETQKYWTIGTNTDSDSDNGAGQRRIARWGDDLEVSNLTVDSDLTVTGNLIVSGTTTTINTTNLAIEDNVVVLNSNQTGTPATTLRAGIEVERGDSVNAKLQFNESNDNWEFTGPKTGTLAVTGDIKDGQITITAGTYLSNGENDTNFTTNQSSNQTITINHDATTRTNNTSTATPGYGGTFTAIDSITTNATGHVTAVNTKTVTIPASDNTNTNQLTVWYVEDSDGTEKTMNHNKELKILGDAYINTNFGSGTGTNASPYDLKVTHKDVARTNSASTDGPSYGGSFTAVASITSDDKGHITGVDTTTVTLPAIASFNGLSGKTAGTGEYSTNSNLTSGRGSGGVSLTINDGYGNANVTFNHKSGTPEQNGASARIEVNTDELDSGDATMSFELKGGMRSAGGAQALNTIITLTETALSMGVDTISRSGSLTIDASGDIILDADGNDIVIKNGAGGDQANITLDNSDNLEIHGMANFTVDASGHIILEPGTGKSVKGIQIADADSAGVIRIGYAENGKNYPVELNADGQAFVNVPWQNTDTNTVANNATITLDARSGLKTGGAFTTDQASNETIYFDIDSADLENKYIEKIDFNLVKTEEVRGSGGAMLLTTTQSSGSSFNFTSANAPTTLSRPTTIYLTNNDTTTVNSQQIGDITFRANNSTTNMKEYSRIRGYIDSKTANSEKGGIRFETLRAGSMISGLVIDDGNVIIGGGGTEARTASFASNVSLDASTASNSTSFTVYASDGTTALKTIYGFTG